jgi:hypothetical protein
MRPNFSAAYALLFCAGLYVPGVLGWIAPIAVLVASDCVITPAFYHMHDFSWVRFCIDQSPNYLAYAGLIALGRMVGASRPWWLQVGGGLVGAMLFYLVTNTASWLAMPNYAKTLAGWIQALTRGTPGYPPTWEFFRNTLISGGLFTGLFVGAVKLTEASDAPEKNEQEADEKKPEGETAKADT